MSKQHPIIAITGSSGAGTSTVRVAMEHIFRRDGFDDRPPRATPSPRTMTKTGGTAGLAEGRKGFACARSIRFSLIPVKRHAVIITPSPITVAMTAAPWTVGDLPAG